NGMSSIVLQCVFFILLVIILAKPLGHYMAKVFNNERVFLSKICMPIEKFIYKILKVNSKQGMNWKEYFFSVISFSIISLVFVIIIQLVQQILPLNPEKLQSINWDLAFNTAVSFVTNTNWQAYSGESTLSY
ncbi:potassium-transporting ATPase subunit KdpA, partial [Clostridium tertium]